MKISNAFCIAAFAALMGCAQQNNTVQLPPTKDYHVNYANKSPTIDGKLDEDVWLHAPFTDEFVQHANGLSAPIKIRAKLLYDNQCLYVGIETEDADIYAKYIKNNDPLFLRDDLAEIFIDPDGDGKNYVEVGIAASGHYYGMAVPEVINGRVAPHQIELPTTSNAASLTDAITVNAVTIKGTLNNPADKDKSWTLESCIPIAVIASTAKMKVSTAPGSHWSVGLFRIDYDHNTPKSKALGFYSWQYVGTFGFHHPERFGKIIFGSRQ